MKTCVFITGTNGTGKTSVARELIRLFGGVAREDTAGDGAIVSVMRDARVVFAGRYEGVKFGGVDYLNATSILPALIAYSFLDHDVFVAEGSYLDTFGPNLTGTMFQAQARLVVCLYADAETLRERVLTRGGKGLTASILKKQRRVLNNAKKYQQHGCTAICFDTRRMDYREIAREIHNWITKTTNNG